MQPVEKIRGIADAIDNNTAGAAESSRKFRDLTRRMMSGETPQDKKIPGNQIE
jgi:hypothetical protein